MPFNLDFHLTQTPLTSPLTVHNVSKSFAGTLAVDDVSFSVKPGEIIGFLGPNGSGKTTTLRMALGLMQPDSGHVELFGQAPGVHAFGRIGFLPEERGLYKKQTAREAIAHIARLNGLPKKLAFQRADDMLTRYGLEDAKRKKNKDMSKGMAQKVQLLAAIAHDPEFYILDEPFSGLDPVNQQVLEGIVREIASGGSTVIFSTHVMEHAERLCDRIILMSGGRKVFDDTTEAALAKAPRKLVIASDDARLIDIVRPFVESIEQREDASMMLTLKQKVEAHSILEKCVEAGVKLTRFDPKAASLHEAFVAMVGADVTRDMSLDSAEGGVS